MKDLVQLTLRRFFGADSRWGTAYSGRLIQFVAVRWAPTCTWRVLWFMGDEALTREITVPWAEIEPLFPALEEFCARPPQLEARFDTSDSWESMELVISVDGRDSQRLSLHLRSSGFEGEGEGLVRGIIDTVERQAGIIGFKRPEWGS